MTMLSSKTLPKLIQAIGYEAVSSDSELFEAALVLLEHDLSHNRPLLLQHLCGVVRALKKKQWSASNDLILAAMLMTLLMTEDVIAAELIDQFGNRRVTLAETACALLMPLVSEMEQHSGKTTQPTEVAHSAHLASFYRATYLDFEVALLCLADHYARKEDLAGLDYVRQRKWAEITDLIYVPLCELLGMWDVRRELADASIAWLLGRKERQALEEAIEEYKGHNETSFRVLQTQVKTAFVRNKLSADILIHESTPGSLYQRQRKARRTDRYFDLKAELSTLRVDVIIHTGNEQGSSEEGLMIEQLECYRALGSLHSLGQPANTKSGEASRLRDLIVKPAANGYSCLITTITWFDPDRRDGEAHRRLVEFRLRTDRMEKINALGIVAAHRLRAPVHVPPNVWWNNAETRELIAGRPNTVSNQQNDTLYVFRPNGEIYTFPRGSTVLDYAFRVHSDLGVYARAFTMNGRRVEKGALLSNGALVEVEFDRSSPGVEEDWLACARTAKALHHIRHTLQQRAKTEKIERFLVDRVVKRELKAHALQLSVQEIEAAIHSVARQLGFSDIRQLYWVVERGELAADEIAMSIIEAQYVSHIAGPNGDPWPKRRIRIARCCLDSSFWLLKKKTGSFIGPHVAPGEPLVGKIVGNAEPPHQTHLVVHHQACPKAPKGSEPLTWHEHAGTRQTVQVTILAWDRPYLLGSILACIYASYGVGNGLNLTKLDAQVLDDASVLVEFVVDAPQEDHLEKLRDALEKLKGSGVIHNFEFWRSLSSAYSSVLSSGRMNPYTLLPIKNPAMLFGRDDDMMTLRRKIGGGERFLTVHGQSGVGKTSLLEQLKRVIEETESEIIPVVFDVQGWESKTIALLAAMEHKVIKELRAQAGPHENTPQLPRIHEKELSRDPFGAFRDWLVRITERLGGRHLLLVIDEFTLLDDAWHLGELEREFFSGFRWLITAAQQTQFLLALHDTALHRARHCHEDGSLSMLVDRSVMIPLSPLDENAAKRLIRQPLGDLYIYDEAVIEGILALSGRLPRYLQLLCLHLADHLAYAGRRNVSRRDLEHVVDQALDGQIGLYNLLPLIRDIKSDSRHEFVLMALARAAQKAGRLACQYQASLGEIINSAHDVAARQRTTMPADRVFIQILEELDASGLVQWQNKPGMASIPIGLYERWLLANA